MLDFDAGASVCAGNALLLNDIQVTATRFSNFSVVPPSSPGSSPTPTWQMTSAMLVMPAVKWLSTNWLKAALGSETSSIVGDLMSGWSSPNFNTQCHHMTW
jgi:hypothetical protein